MVKRIVGIDLAVASDHRAAIFVPNLCQMQPI